MLSFSQFGHTSNEENPPRKIIVDSNGERSVIHEEPITLQMLPDDAISNILSQLDDVKSLISFSLTNKVFQESTRGVKSLSFKKNDFGERYLRTYRQIITDMVMDTHNLETLYVENPKDAPKLENLPVRVWCRHSRYTLKSLTLIDSENDTKYIEVLTSQEWKVDAASLCRNLETLILENVYMDLTNPFNCKPLTSLKHLTIRNAYLTEAVLDRLLHLCPNLEELCLIKCSGIRSFNLQTYACCSTLRQFELDTEDFDDFPLDLLKLKAPKLENLTVVTDSFREESSNWKGSIQIASKSLKSIDLSLGEPFSLDFHKSYLTEVERVQVMGDHFVWEEVLEILERSGQTLKTLDLSIAATPEALNPAAFFLLFPALEFLSLNAEAFQNFCKGISADSVISCPSLKELHIEYFNRTMEEAKFHSALLRGSPKLQLITNILAAVQGSSSFSKEPHYHKAIAKLKRSYPGVKFHC